MAKGGTTNLPPCYAPSGGVAWRQCVMMARTLHRTFYDAQALRAGAIIAVLGGLRAEEVRAMGATKTEVLAWPTEDQYQRVTDRLSEAEGELHRLRWDLERLLLK